MNLDNKLRFGNLDMVMFLPVNNTEALYFTTSGKMKLNNETGRLNFINVSKPYSYSVNVANKVSAVHVVGHSETTIYSIYNNTLISLIYYRPKLGMDDMVLGMQYEFICPELTHDYLLDGFSFGMNYMFVSFRSRTVNSTYVFVIVDIFDFTLAGQKCIKEEQVDFVTYNMDSRVTFYRNGLLYSYELSQGSIVIYARLGTDQPYTLNIRQTSNRQPNDLKTVNVEIIDNPFTDFKIELDFSTVDVLRGAWTEMQVGRKTFRGNNGDLYLDGIEYPSNIRISAGEENLCPITNADKNDLLYTNKIKYLRMLKQTVMLVSTRDRYGLFSCNNDEKNTPTNPCQCQEINRATLEPNTYVLYAYGIVNRFILMTTSDSIAVSSSKLKVKDSFIDSDSTDVLDYNGNNYVLLKRQKSTCLVYPSAQMTRFLYIRESADSPSPNPNPSSSSGSSGSGGSGLGDQTGDNPDQVADTNDEIWTVVLNLTMGPEGKGPSKFKVISHHKMRFFGAMDLQKKTIFRFRRIFGSTNTFMFSYKTLDGDNSNFGIAYTKIETMNCPGNDEACLRVEKRVKVFDYAKNLTGFDFCPMGQNVVVVNKNFKKGFPNKLKYKVVTKPLNKPQPEASYGRIWFQYPFYSAGLGRVLDIQCHGVMGAFQILARAKANTDPLSNKYSQQRLLGS